MSTNTELYYLPASPPCRNVLLAARAAGITLTLKTLNIMEGEHMTPEFLKINPEHCIPTLNDNGLIVWESRPIMCYLIDMYAKDPASQALYPKDPKKRVLVDQRLYFDAGTLYASLVEYFSPVMRGATTAPDEMKKKKFEQNLATLDNHLGNQEWVAGDAVSIADMSILVTVNTAEAIGLDVGQFKNVSDWLERCRKEMAKYGYDEIETAGANMLGQFFKSRLSN